MKSTAENFTYHYQDNQVAYKQPFEQVDNEENFQSHFEQIWDKVKLLTEVAIIASESDKFMYAYRFAELALEKVCKENALLQLRLKEVSDSH